ncbi:splhairy [Penaeus vannamei]|uniref:Splhairy n=1 Tax=Penaeus vannamei TaxID=6689 RepID=A0A3R7MEW4_PENVA|nr:splhairy [Penaeus vannamei]
MEKKRRQRINRCLNDLKTLVLEALKKDPSRYSKLEKADILEMTVRHVQALHRHDLVGVRGRVAGGDEKGKYRAGFTQCAVEVTRYLANMGGSVPHDLQAKVIAHLNSVTKSLMGQASGVPAGSGLASGSSSVVVGGGVVTLTPSAPPPSTASSSAPLAPPLVVTTVADSSTTLAGLSERCPASSGEIPARRLGESTVMDATPSQGPVTVGAGVTLVPARLASGQVALVLPPGTTLPPYDAPQSVAPTSKSSLESVASSSSNFGVSRLEDSSTDYSSMSLSTQLSSTPSSFGGPRIVTFTSRPHEGFLYSVSEASSAPYTTPFKGPSGFADETPFPPAPSGREQSSSFSSAEKGGPALSTDASRGVGEHTGEARLVSSEASAETCPRLVPFHPSPSLKLSVSFSDSSKAESQRASSYLSLYSDPASAAPVVRPTPTLPEGVALPSSRPEHAQGTPSLYPLRPDSSCSAQPPAATSYRSSFVTVVSSSVSSSSTSVSSAPNAPSTPIVSSTSGAPTSLSVSTAPSIPSILYVSSTPSVLPGKGNPSSPSVPLKPGVPVTPSAPTMPYHPSSHSALPTSTVQPTFSLPPVITFPLAPHPLSVNRPSIHFRRSPNATRNPWSESSALRTPSSPPKAAPSSSVADPSPPATERKKLLPVPSPCTLPVPGNQSPGASSSSGASLSLGAPSVPTSATSDIATPSAEPLNLVTNNQSLDLSCGKRPPSLKIAPTPTWRRSSAPYRPPLVGRRSQPWRPW